MPGFPECTPQCLTHYPYKEVSEDKGADPYPEENVESGKDRTSNAAELDLDVQPLIEGEQLEEYHHCIQ